MFRSPWTMAWCCEPIFTVHPEEGKYPVILNLWPLREGPRLPGGLPRSVAEDGREPPGRDRGFDQQVPELGSCRSGEVGAGRVRRVCESIPVAAGRSPGYVDPFSPRETRDFYLCIEWAGTQPWSNGKVGLLGNFLLRDQSVACGFFTAPSPGGHDSLGRGCRLVPRHGLPWRNPVYFFGPTGLRSRS